MEAGPRYAPENEDRTSAMESLEDGLRKFAEAFPEHAHRVLTNREGEEYTIVSLLEDYHNKSPNAVSQTEKVRRFARLQVREGRGKAIKIFSAESHNQN